MNLEELIKELKALIEKVESAEEGTDTTEDEARMSELVAEIEQRKAAEGTAENRAAAIEAARAAIENGEAKRMSDNNIIDMTPDAPVDEQGAYKRAWLKELATRGGIKLVEGNEMTTEERAAFTHLTTNTQAVIPVELQDEIISLIERSAVMYGDIRKSTLKHQFELVRHVAIAAGDAAATDEGAAPADDEQNTFETITLTGVEIKKTVKMSRKMAVQAMDGFEAYIVQEIADRVGVAADKFVIARLTDATLGMAAANKIAVAKTGELTKADIVKALAKVNTFGNAAPKGIVIYANNSTIWNHIAMVEDGNGRSYFVDEKTEDPAVQGRIFGKLVKCDDNLRDGVIYVGCPDLMQGNDFDGIDVAAYVATDGTQRHCFDGYLLFDAGVRVPTAWVELAVTAAA